jgi:hypothetical protein
MTNLFPPFATGFKRMTVALCGWEGLLHVEWFCCEIDRVQPAVGCITPAAGLSH